MSPTPTEACCPRCRSPRFATTRNGDRTTAVCPCGFTWTVGGNKPAANKRRARRRAMTR